MMRRRLLILAVLAVGSASTMLASSYSRGSPAQAAEKSAADPAAVERARETVKMLDDLYKGYVVHITGTYVDARESMPAASVTKKVFQHMEKKGWGKTRLVDATGRPARKANLPASDFEKRAIAKIKGGDSYYEEVEKNDGKTVLHAATVVPAVMKQCLNCHEGIKEGQPMGALVYEITVK